MGRTVAGCFVLKEAPAREPSRYKVVICQLPDAPQEEAYWTAPASSAQSVRWLKHASLARELEEVATFAAECSIQRERCHN